MTFLKMTMMRKMTMALLRISLVEFRITQTEALVLMMMMLTLLMKCLLKQRNLLKRWEVLLKAF